LLLCSSKEHAAIHNKAERTSGSKLTEKQVGRIREFLDVGINAKALAEHFSIGIRAITRIGDMQSWKHINNRGVWI
jgi:hypothetical protein